MRLQNLFAVGVFSAGALGLGAMVADRTLLTREILLERLESRGLAIAEAIGTLAIPQLRDGKPVDRKSMQLFARLPSVMYVVIHDRDGRQVYEDAPELERMRGESAASRLPVETDIMYQDLKLGTVRVGLSLQKVQTESREMLVRGILLAVIVLALLAVLSWLMGRALGRHLGRFTQALIRWDPRYGSQRMVGLLRRSELTAVWGAFRDMHARLEEEESKRARVEKLKNDLAGMIVHDLKQPLAVLQSVLMMLRDPELAEYSKASGTNPLTMADRSVMRLNTMIEEVLQIARMNDADVPLSRERLSLKEFLEGCAAEHRFIVEHTGREFRCVTDEEAGTRWIHGDGALLKRLVGNLIMNAVQYSAPGRPVTLGAHMTGEADRVAITVHNEGLSMSKRAIAKMFEKYATSGEELRNVGLGLAFCNLVARRHEAVLSAASTEGKGTTFTLTMNTSAYPRNADPTGHVKVRGDESPEGAP